jgi:hypothetical protein
LGLLAGLVIRAEIVIGIDVMGMLVAHGGIASFDVGNLHRRGQSEVAEFGGPVIAPAAFFGARTARADDGATAREGNVLARAHLAPFLTGIKPVMTHDDDSPPF